ncbi:MAG TPA: chitin-binding protein, partial [Mycobacterium sp.]
HGPGDRGGPGDFRGPGGPRDFGPRPGDAFRGFRGAPWGDGPAPWGWGAPPRAGWGGPFPPPGGIWNQGPINYWGYNEQPIWDPGQNGGGFYFFGIWIPL